MVFSNKAKISETHVISRQMSAPKGLLLKYVNARLYLCRMESFRRSFAKNEISTYVIVYIHNGDLDETTGEFSLSVVYKMSNLWDPIRPGDN